MEIGKCYFFKTLGHYYLGRLVSRDHTHAVIDDGSEVFETGPLDTFFGKGQPKMSERVPNGWMVPLSGANVGPWTTLDNKKEHDLPDKAVGI